MGLQEAGQLGTVDDVVNLIDIFCSVMNTLLPIIGCCFAVYVGNKIYKRHQLKKKQKQIQKSVNKAKQNKPNVQNVNNGFGSDAEMLKKIPNLDDQIYDNRFDNLALEFDKNGRAKGV